MVRTYGAGGAGPGRLFSNFERIGKGLYPTVVKQLEKGLPELLAFYRLPRPHWALAALGWIAGGTRGFSLISFLRFIISGCRAHSMPFSSGAPYSSGCR